MAEILIKAVNATHPDPETDRTGCYKRGMPVVVMPDGHPWGSAERLPRFVVIKVPGVPVDRVQKYIGPEYTPSPEVDPAVYRRRVWQIRWADLPAAARNKLTNTGQLIVKAGAYAGAYDYTWDQIKSYFRNLSTGLDESDDL